MLAFVFPHGTSNHKAKFHTGGDHMLARSSSRLGHDA
jgi:hypothetical protein